MANNHDLWLMDVCMRARAEKALRMWVGGAALSKTVLFLASVHSKLPLEL